MPKTYPPRFSKIENWCDWIEGLSKKSGEALQALQKADKQNSAAKLDGLRAHFYNLHRETGLINQSDLIYLFWKSTQKKEVPVKNLQQVIALLDVAPASASVTAAPTQYRQTKDAWLKQVNPILEDGKVEPNEKAALQKTTDAFFLRFGRDFE